MRFNALNDLHNRQKPAGIRTFFYLCLVFLTLTFSLNLHAEHSVSFFYCGETFQFDGHQYPSRDDKIKRIEAWINSPPDPVDEEKRARCEKNLIAKQEAELRHQERCSTNLERYNEIYDKCYVEHYESNADRSMKRAVQGMCDRTACNPSLLERFKY